MSYINTLYLECNAGISGDMTVAALLDLGADESVLTQALDSIPADGYRVEITRVKKAGVDCCDFHVILDEEHENHDHDMEYLHGPADGHSHEHEDVHHHGHSHEDGDIHHHEHSHEDGSVHHHGHSHEDGSVHHHGHSHEHGDVHHHEHRGMTEITELIHKTHMTDAAKQTALRIFDIIAEAEAKAHSVPVSEVHFHEVGAIDSVVDVIAAAVCLDNLQVREVIVPKLCEGTGTVRCQHGVLPIPVPAVANIVSEYGIAMEILPVQGEFVTPTGAAVVAAIRTAERLPERFNIRRIGMGAGKRSYSRASILRAMLIEPVSDNGKTTICKLESNIDDCSGEALGYTMERLFAAGARDVFYQPVYMKKNRPGWQLNVICDADCADVLEEIIFKHTTTIGIRRCVMERSVLERKLYAVDTEYGSIQVKRCILPGGEKRYYPEYESVAAICRAKELSYGTVYQAAIEACRKPDASLNKET